VIVLVVEYEGTAYYGFQRQKDLPTIQAELEEALFRLCGKRIRTLYASRTDRGVHAIGQVVGFNTMASHSSSTWMKGLNFYLPPDISVRRCFETGDGFDVRKAKSREYSYTILNCPTPSPLMRRFSYSVSHPLDVEEMEKVAKFLLGEHDFASFSSLKEGTVRHIYDAGFERRGDQIIFRVEANSFLPHQVRNMVGGLIRVGLKKKGAGEFRQEMELRKPIGPTAPPRGLSLMEVNYEDLYS
jgi:tRNA pseudouridine38-40 synthase